MKTKTPASKIIGEAEVRLDNKTVKLPVHQGSENECGIDIAKLRSQTSCITLDPGFGNTGSCTSAITFIDGDKGILRYRGIPIEELAERSTFLETSYLLIYGELPTREQLEGFSSQIAGHHTLPGQIKRLFDAFPKDAHPMAVLSSAICSLSAYYPDSLQASVDKCDIHIRRLLAKIITIAAYSFRKSKGQPLVDPDPKQGYTDNFIRMMFADPGKPYDVDPIVVRALRMILILHADHEQNCSTSTVRIVGSSQANLYAAISAGACALWGPWHGGANQAVIEMLQGIKDRGDSVKDLIRKVKDKSSDFRLMGFGHRVYKNFDPRAKIIKSACDEVLSKLGIQDPLLDIAKELEAAALKDEYFIERKLYPNVDFYSGIILRAFGIPVNAFTVIFAIGRLPGWVAHWKEMLETPGLKIYRPRQIYTGQTKRPYIPVEERS